MLSLQSPFNDVDVSVIGDEQAPNLFRLDNVANNVYDVRVTNSGDLAADSETEYQVYF